MGEAETDARIGTRSLQIFGIRIGVFASQEACPDVELARVAHRWLDRVDHQVLRTGCELRDSGRGSGRFSFLTVLDQGFEDLEVLAHLFRDHP